MPWPGAEGRDRTQSWHCLFQPLLRGWTPGNSRWDRPYYYSPYNFVKTVNWTIQKLDIHMYSSQYNVILWNVHSNTIPHCTRSGGGKEVVREERISVFYGNHLKRPREKDLWGKLFSLGGGAFVRGGRGSEPVSQLLPLGKYRGGWGI